METVLKAGETVLIKTKYILRGGESISGSKQGHFK